MNRNVASLLAFAAVTGATIGAFAAPAPADDIRDIRGPIAIPLWWVLPLAVALAALVTAGLVFLVRFWRARRARALTALERALAALAVAEAHAREGRAQEWANIVADTTRGALAVRIGVEVLPQTTAELARSCANDADAARVVALLETCDLARFAKANLDASALLASTSVARDVTERLFAPPQPPTPPSTVTS
jgi:hypothetical protein